MSRIMVEVYRRSAGLSAVIPSVSRAAEELGVDRRTVKARMGDGFAIYVRGYPLHVRKVAASTGGEET